MNTVAVACDTYGFQGDHTQLLDMVVRLLFAIHLLCSKNTVASQHAEFCGYVDGIYDMWQNTFGLKPPVSLHILEVHWRIWFTMVGACGEV